MEKWEKLLSSANDHKIKSEELLDRAAQELMRTKGFSRETCELFEACFAGGTETIVSFNHDGEFNDLGLENYCNMSKEEIIEYMCKYLTPSNVELLKKG